MRSHAGVRNEKTLLSGLFILVPMLRVGIHTAIKRRHDMHPHARAWGREPLTQ